jgi:hypothetical protein
MKLPNIPKNHAVIIDVESKEARVEEILYPQLKWLQGAVEGKIQVIYTTIGGEPYEMYVNEEGLINKLPYNELASHYANIALVGNVVIVPTGVIE